MGSIYLNNSLQNISLKQITNLMKIAFDGKKPDDSGAKGARVRQDICKTIFERYGITTDTEEVQHALKKWK